MSNFNPLPPLSTLIFLVIAANPGGEGKTMIARLLKALWQLFGSRAHLLDSDPGNWSLSGTNPEAMPLGWSVKTFMVPEILKVTNGQNVALDLGGNGLASAKEISGLVPALQRAYSTAGYRTIALLPYSTNKVGASTSIQQVSEELNGFEKYYVKVNRDGSHYYNEDFQADNMVALGHLDTGFQTLITNQYKSFDAIITHPDDNHHLARAYIGQWMHEFASQPFIKAIIGGDVDILRSINPPRRTLRFNVSQLEHTSDKNILNNIHESNILDEIDAAGWTAEGLRAVASKLNRGLL
jgi:hypothetical protein